MNKKKWNSNSFCLPRFHGQWQYPPNAIYTYYKICFILMPSTYVAPQINQHRKKIAFSMILEIQINYTHSLLFFCLSFVIVCTVYTQVVCVRVCVSIVFFSGVAYFFFICFRCSLFWKLNFLIIFSIRKNTNERLTLFNSRNWTNERTSKRIMRSECVNAYGECTVHNI